MLEIGAKVLVNGLTGKLLTVRKSTSDRGFEIWYAKKLFALVLLGGRKIGLGLLTNNVEQVPHGQVHVN